VSIVEEYPMDGRVVTHSRRDKRSGPHRGRLKSVTPGSATIEVSWGEPHGGYLLETFRLNPDNPNVLEVISDIRVDKDAVTGEKNPPFFRYSVEYERASGSSHGAQSQLQSQSQS